MTEQAQVPASLDAMASLMAALGALTVSDTDERMNKVVAAEQQKAGTVCGVDRGYCDVDREHTDALFRLFIAQANLGEFSESLNWMADACLRAAEYLKSGAHLDDFSYPPGLEQFSAVLEAPNARVVPHMIEALYRQSLVFRQVAHGYDPTEHERWERLRE